MADSKKVHFSKSPILKIFSRKFLRLVLGLVGLNDAKGIDVAQRIWPWGCPTKAQKQPKSTEKAFFGCFWAFVGQPHGHIRWATSMPFASFNPLICFSSLIFNCRSLGCLAETVRTFLIMTVKKITFSLLILLKANQKSEPIQVLE